MHRDPFDQATEAEVQVAAGRALINRILAALSAESEARWDCCCHAPVYDSSGNSEPAPAR